MTREQEVINILEHWVRTHSAYDKNNPSENLVIKRNESVEKLLQLIDSATREAYKQGYIDAGIKAITEQSGEHE